MTVYCQIGLLLVFAFQPSLFAREKMFDALGLPLNKADMEMRWPSNSVYWTFIMQTTTKNTNSEEVSYRRYVVDKPGNNPFDDSGRSPTYAQPVLQYHTIKSSKDDSEILQAVEVYKTKNNDIFLLACKELNVLPLTYDRACSLASEQIWDGRQFNFVWISSGETNDHSLAVRFCYRDKEIYSILAKKGRHKQATKVPGEYPQENITNNVLDMSWFRFSRFRKVAQITNTLSWAAQVTDIQRREKVLGLIQRDEDDFKKGIPVYDEIRKCGALFEKKVVYHYAWAVPGYRFNVYTSPSQRIQFINEVLSISRPYEYERTFKVLVNFRALPDDVSVILPYSGIKLRKMMKDNIVIGQPTVESRRCDGKFTYQVFEKENIALLIKNNIVQCMSYGEGIKMTEVLIFSGFDHEIEDEPDVYYQ